MTEWPHCVRTRADFFPASCRGQAPAVSASPVRQVPQPMNTGNAGCTTHIVRNQSKLTRMQLALHFDNIQLALPLPDLVSLNRPSKALRKLNVEQTFPEPCTMAASQPNRLKRLRKFLLGRSKPLPVD